MNPNNVWKKNREFYIGVAGTVLEGLLSGSLFTAIDLTPSKFLRV